MQQRLLPRRRRLLCYVVLLLFVVGCFATLKIISSTEEARGERTISSKFLHHQQVYENEVGRRNVPPPRPANTDNIAEIGGEKQVETNIAALKLTTDFKDNQESDDGDSSPNYNVHIFYYAWYGNPTFDGKYVHWNHRLLPHWNTDIAKYYKQDQHTPPDDIGSNFYPSLGPYSSRDPKVIDDHMRQIKSARVGVIVFSWYPPGKADNEGIPSDSLVTPLLDAAAKYNLKVTLHVEPYEGRDDQTLHNDIKYIIDNYSMHKAFYKYKTIEGRELPMLYIYDSYQTPPEAWAQLMTLSGSHSVRSTPYDCIFIALMAEMSHRSYIDIGGFDGFYTYFASDKFTYGSTWRFWPQLVSIAKQTNSLFIPSVGPGYIDTRVRPWNGENTRLRDDGSYYKKSWKAALQTNSQIISVTSFNEWHEGTQIEKAIPKSVPGQIYKDYQPHDPDYYLTLTRVQVDKFNAMRQ